MKQLQLAAQLHADANAGYLPPNIATFIAGLQASSRRRPRTTLTDNAATLVKPTNTKSLASLTIVALALAAFNLSAATLHVSLESTNPVPPYATWETAASVIQDAVDASHDGDTVLVTNGVYAAGGKTNEWGDVENRVTITNSITLESVNGPSVTTIMGDFVLNSEMSGYEGTARCVYLGTDAILSGFTLTKGVGWYHGGGVLCDPSAVVTNCDLRGNVADAGFGGPPRPNGGGAYGGGLYNCTLEANWLYTYYHNGGLGGGAARSTLYNCTLTGNFAAVGGGAVDCTLYNCTLTGNWAGERGGAVDCTLYNCTVTGNDEGGIGGYWGSSTVFNSIVCGNTTGNYGADTILNYCLTSPLPTSGVGNIDAEPRFVNAAAGDFRLREDSPCIDAGTNLVGAIVPVWNADVWDFVLAPYPYDPTDILGNSRFIDGNGDGEVAWDIGAYEFDPRMLRFAPALHLTSGGMTFTVKGEAGKSVRVERSPNLKDWEPVATVPIPASGQTLIDPAATAEPFLFYRAVSVP